MRFFILILSCLLPSLAFAHFGMLIPASSMVVQGDDTSLELDLSFSHPFEKRGMDLPRPLSFSVYRGGQIQDLLPSLVQTRIMHAAGWSAFYPIGRPGLMQFVMEPQPYWEGGEDRYIIHYTKAVVSAFGEEQGWELPVGLKTEIVPLSRPYGLYAGNLFQGRVLMDGKPVPFAEVEIEPWPSDNLKPLNDYMVAQVVRADGAGVFSYAAPTSGWWGFAALSKADFELERQGQMKPVELGAVIWVEFHSFPKP